MLISCYCCNTGVKQALIQRPTFDFWPNRDVVPFVVGKQRYAGLKHKNLHALLYSSVVEKVEGDDTAVSWPALQLQTTLHLCVS